MIFCLGLHCYMKIFSVYRTLLEILEVRDWFQIIRISIQFEFDLQNNPIIYIFGKAVNTPLTLNQHTIGNKGESQNDYKIKHAKFSEQLTFDTHTYV